MPTTAPKAEQSKSKFIVVAEDDKFYSNIYKVKLTQEGYETQVAEDGEKALSIAQQRTPDLILLDLIMPGMDGFDTLTALQKNPTLKNVPVIVLTNLEQDEDRKRAESLGAKEYVVKSNMSLQEIINKIKSYLV